MKYTAVLREILYSMIRRIVERAERYAGNQGKDFTIKRTLTDVVQF